MALLSLGGLGSVGAACAPGGAPSEGASPATPRRADLRVHTAKRRDVSDWIEAGLDQDIDGWKAKHPTLHVTLEYHGTATDTFLPQILAVSAAGTLGDVVWFPPRHRSHIAFGTKYKIVRDLQPLAKASKYDLGQFYKGALDQNTWEGKLYWLSFISEPVVPVIAVNLTRIRQLGLPEPKDDWTFDELGEWARRGTTAETFGYFRGQASGDPFRSGPYLRQWGVEPVDKAGRKATFMDTSQAFIQALTFRYNLVNVWKASPNLRDGPVSIESAVAQEGKLLACDVWPVAIQGWLSRNKTVELDFVLRPTVKKGERRRSMLNEHVFGVTPNTRFADEAFQFLTWIAGKEMNVQGLVQGFKGPIARADVWADPRITEQWPTYKKLRPIMETVEPDFFVANFRGEEVDTTMDAIYNKMERGEMPVLEAANEIQRALQVVLDKEPA
jgi:ABC-type glycerol-3-phosphate transport system substrate-binding protein